jgi:hypothetical protein
VTNSSTLSRLLESLPLIDNPSAIYDEYDAIVYAHSVGRWRRDLPSTEQERLDTYLAPLLDRIDALDPISS